MTLNDFTACLTEATDLCSPALGRKFYLADVASVLETYRGISWAGFAELAVAAHQAGLIELTRADLVIDTAKTEASEIAHETAAWHYLEG
jgi:hypothetical protein